MLAPVLSLLAVVLGLTLVFADEVVARVAPRGPEVGAVQARALGLILLVAGLFAFLAWTR